ncbi:MAG: hypothetical protein ABIX44_10355 [Cryobacterium sp.]
MARSELRRGRLTDWLNRTLLPWIGPPPLGPYGEPSEAELLAEQLQATCPICRQLMSLHEVDRSGERTMIYHPTQP